ncbi:MAG: T9SS type A sorting domain-containing protein, partial [Opitutaceae bacterium]|nr:T9SS type A sorting domain-containing protein [Cytophagales bacterium]
SENNGPSKAELAEMANFVKTLNVYPNPSVGEMIVDLNVSTDATVVLVDMFGKVAAEKQVFAGSNSFKFDGSNLPKGIYIVKVLGTELSKSVLIK